MEEDQKKLGEDDCADKFTAPAQDKDQDEFKEQMKPGEGCMDKISAEGKTGEKEETDEHGTKECSIKIAAESKEVKGDAFENEVVGPTLIAAEEFGENSAASINETDASCCGKVQADASGKGSLQAWESY